LHTDRLVFIMADTREYIIDESFKLFLNHSYEAVSISMISEAIGFTKGALYHHFASKEELFIAVVDKYLEIKSLSVDVDNITLADYTNYCTEHARSILQKLFNQTDDFLPISYLSLIVDSFRHYKGFADKTLNFIDMETEKVEKIIKNAIINGEIRNDIDIKVVASQFFSLSAGLAGDFIRNSSIDSALNLMRNQINQLYQLLKI
jgi:TetR/AcrR family transcriptional regulator, transcriptional repressor for nem operon